MIDPADYDIKIIDWHYKDFRERLTHECADALVFGVTCMTGYQIGSMLEAVKLARVSTRASRSSAEAGIRRSCPSRPSHALDRLHRDGTRSAHVQGSGGVHSDRTDTESIAGVGYKKDGRLFINKPPPIENINIFPYPPNHLLDHYEDFLVETSFGKRVAYLLTSQGCPSNCYFCSEAAFMSVNGRRGRSANC